VTESTVRLARTSDVDDVAAVQVAAWRADYTGVLPAEVLAGLDPDDISLEWARGLLMGGAQRLLVAIGEGGSAVGYAAVGPCADPDATATTGEIHALEVHPDHRGAGHGSRLLAACVDLLRESGSQSAVTWVLLADERRRAFFIATGWGPDSAYRDLSPGDDSTVRQVRLATDLS
jgi:ribosomal protein S18 acetylase RimI-like enzyme